MFTHITLHLVWQLFCSLNTVLLSFGGWFEVAAFWFLFLIVNYNKGQASIDVQFYRVIPPNM